MSSFYHQFSYSKSSTDAFGLWKENQTYWTSYRNIQQIIFIRGALNDFPANLKNVLSVFRSIRALVYVNALRRVLNWCMLFKSIMSCFVLKFFKVCCIFLPRWMQCHYICYSNVQTVRKKISGVALTQLSLTLHYSRRIFY